MKPFAMSSDELIVLLSSQPQWQDRYRQLIKLTAQLPMLTERQEQYQVSGCESPVWLKIEKQPDHTFLITGDSDGRIIKGLLCVIIILAQGKTADEILALDFTGYLKKMKLMDELSQSRLLGLKKIIAHMIAEVKKQH